VSVFGGKASTAEIYVDELRSGLDPKIVPLFPPDTAVDVGDFGLFEEGRFIKKGSVSSRGLDVSCDEQAVPPWSWASSGKVSIGPSVSVPGPTGSPLVKATIRFSGARAVLVSFDAGVERSVLDADDFGARLMALWHRGELPADRAVVWSLRRAVRGTVCVSSEKGNTIDVSADPAALAGAALALSGLSVGVRFSGEGQNVYAVSQGPLVAWLRLLRLDPGDAPRVIDAYRFEPGSEDLALAIGDLRPVPLTALDVLGPPPPSA